MTCDASKSMLCTAHSSRRNRDSRLSLNGGWDHKNQTLTPIKLAELLAGPHNPGLSWVMDSLAAAAEAGRLDADKYVEQIFAGRKMCALSAMSCEKLAATGGSQTVTIMLFGS
jgi:hypothetical protein